MVVVVDVDVEVYFHLEGRVRYIYVDTVRFSTILG